MPDTNAQNEREQMQESLLAARKLEEWNHMAGVISHEINNPLAAIGNLLFLMQLNPELPAALGVIVQQATDEVKRIETLTRSTLGFYRTSSEPERVNLVSSAEAVQLLLGPTLRQRAIEMEIQSAGDCSVNAYAVETRQVLLNLVRNACEATTRTGAKVTVSLEGRPDDVRFVVADEGPGISATIMPTLFQFGVSTRSEPGKGLGLWLVKQVIKKHGGNIDVESHAGQGTRFTVLWPRRIAKANDNQERLAAGAGT
jgi:signal transduction histidine kinase